MKAAICNLLLPAMLLLAGLSPEARAAVIYDLPAGFSAANNPNGPWAYGWKGTLGGAFARLTVPHVSIADNGVSIPSWQLTSSEAPVVYVNTSPSTAIAGGGLAVFPPGTMWFGPGQNGRPENFGVIRFTVPAGGSGNYEIKVAVSPVYNNGVSPQGDSDFHVVKNGVELFGQNLAPTANAGYTNSVALSSGDTVEFAIGRGADGNEYGSGRKIAGSLTATTITPPPTGVYDLAGGFSGTNNPNGPWVYGWKGALGGTFTPLTVPHVSIADGGQSVPSWQLSSFQTPAVYKNTTGGTVTAGGGAATFPAGTVWYFPGENGRPENLGVIRFTVPSGKAGNYEVRVAVGPVYNGSPQGDTDFHVARNGTELFGQNLAAGARTGYTNIVALNEGDSVDFAIGRGADGNQFGSGLKIEGSLTATTNAAPPTPVVTSFDLAAGFSATSNPNGPWVYGWKGTLGGTFTPLTVPHVSSADGGQSVPSWQLSSFQTPAVYKNTTGGTVTAGGGAATFPAGTVWYFPGENGRPENLGVIRFTVPSGKAGNYEVRVAVGPVYDGSPQGDTDFHVARNGTELFGQNLPAGARTGYTNIVTLNEGDSVDFAIGRGADGNQYGSGLKIAGSLTATTNAAPPTPVVTSFDLAAGFSATSNPNGPWVYGWKGTLGGTFTPLTVPHVSIADGGQSVPSWQLSSFQTPAVYKNTTGGTVTAGGGAATFPAGTVWYFPGENGRPENLGVIRFTVPLGKAGNYEVRVAAGPVYNGSPQGDTDFHVARNGTELFGQNLAAGARTGYTNIVTLNEGDSVDFAIGRGADGNQFGSGLKIEGSLTATTNRPSSPPIIAGQPASQTVNENSPVSFRVTASGVSPLNYEWFLNGVLVPGANGSLLSIPAARLSDAGEYRVRVTDFHGSTLSSPAVLTVIGVNHAPLANAQSINTLENMSRTLTLTGSDSDGDALTFSIVAPPAHGTLTGTGAVRTYVPAANYSGQDSFTFKVSDGVLESAPATVSITVRSVNDAPVAHIELSPLLRLFPGESNLFVLSLNNSNALVELDASGSFDPDHDVLEFHWLADGGVQPIATGMLAIVEFSVGPHTLTLLASDSSSTGTDTKSFEVITIGDAISIIISCVNDSGLPRNRIRPLTASLKAATESFDRNNTTSGLNQLDAFLHKVRAQIERLDPALSSKLTGATQALLEAITQTIAR